MALKQKLAEIWENIDSWFYIKIRSNVRYFFEKVAGTFVYARFIWKSNAFREWDYAYLYDIIEFKLRRMAKQLRADDFVANHEQTYNEIMSTIKHLENYNKCEECTDTERTREEILADVQKQQQSWNNFHDALKQQAQRWWS